MISDPRRLQKIVGLLLGTIPSRTIWHCVEDRRPSCPGCIMVHRLTHKTTFSRAYRRGQATFIRKDTGRQHIFGLARKTLGRPSNRPCSGCDTSWRIQSTIQQHSSWLLCRGLLVLSRSDISTLICLFRRRWVVESLSENGRYSFGQFVDGQFVKNARRIVAIGPRSVGCMAMLGSRVRGRILPWESQ